MFTVKDQELRYLWRCIWVFLAQKIAKKPFTVVGNGMQKRDFTHVSDITDAIIKVSSKKI